MIGIEKELLIFLTAFSSGLFLRGTYRCLECFRDIVKHSFLAVGIEDLFYWIFVEMFYFRGVTFSAGNFSYNLIKM
jgi:hypothetical protein